MKVLIIGSGGREHTLAWKLYQELPKDNLFIAPGNAGTLEIATNLPYKEDNFSELSDFAEDNRIDLTIVGPEVPLDLGIVNYFDERKLKIFGPTKEAAKIESSKVWAKRFMREFNIPTADFVVADSIYDAIKYGQQLLEDYGAGVLKADRLAAGKGVVVYKTKKELGDALEYFEKLGLANDRIIVERYLKGEEASFKVWTDGEHIIPMIPTQDHKPVFDNDEGPNTGGMGAYTNPLVTIGMEKKIIKEIMKPVVEGLAEQLRPYKGVLYAGLMIVEGQPYVLEFNCRYGDPETEVIMLLLNSSLVEISQRCIEGTLDKIRVEWGKGEALDIVLATEGYPGDYKHNLEGVICGLDELINDVLVFHAGTKYNKEGQLINSGGRVLNIVGKGRSLQEAYSLSRRGADLVCERCAKSLNGAKLHFRKDIGNKTLRNSK